MVKVSRLLGDREIGLANAMLINMSGHPIRSKSICKQEATWFSACLKGISYYEDLPAPQDVKKLNHLLAALSGRMVRELKESPTLKPLIKGGDSPRPIDSFSFDEEDLSEDPSERAFDRAAIIAILIYVLFALVGMFTLLYFGIYRTLR